LRWPSLVFVAMIGPVYIAPLFNTYQPVGDPAIREPVLRLARANGIDADQVWQMDASRQTTRISANVSGMLGTERITLNDNLLMRTSREGVLAVMGHEIGHYVLNHTYELLVSFGLLIVIGFAAIAVAFPALAARHAGRWQIRGVDDPAGLPLIVLLFGVYFFLITPLTNSIIRSNEYEADVFGLNAARQPEGFAEAALLLGEYRKLHPGRLEEILFFDHPSGYTRISTAMRWKAEHAVHVWRRGARGGAGEGRGPRGPEGRTSARRDQRPGHGVRPAWGILIAGGGFERPRHIPSLHPLHGGLSPH
jgi:STE24 endopeptidase